MEDCTIEKEESILKCGTQYNLEKITELFSEKIVRVSDALVSIRSDLDGIENKTDKIVAILAQNELIIASLQQLTENYADLQKTNRDDHSAMHSKMQSLSETAISRAELKYTNLEIKVENKMKGVENKYDQRLGDCVTHKGMTLIVTVIGIFFALLTFVVTYVQGLIP